MQDRHLSLPIIYSGKPKNVTGRQQFDRALLLLDLVEGTIFEYIGNMLFPVVDPKKWAKHYSLKSPNLPCGKCGRILECEVPFAYENIRGLKSAPHGCPEAYDHSVSRSVASVDIYSIESLFSIFSST